MPPGSAVRTSTAVAAGALLLLATAACGADQDAQPTVTQKVTDSSGNDRDRQVFDESGVRDARVDCGGGDVEIAGNDVVVDLTGECVSVLVTGDGNDVDVDEGDLESIAVSGNGTLVEIEDHVDTVLVSGDGAHVEVGSTDSVQVSGNGARVEYGSGPAPDVEDTGSGTEVVQD